MDCCNIPLNVHYYLVDNNEPVVQWNIFFSLQYKIGGNIKESVICFNPQNIECVWFHICNGKCCKEYNRSYHVSCISLSQSYVTILSTCMPMFDLDLLSTFVGFSEQPVDPPSCNILVPHFLQTLLF